MFRHARESRRSSIHHFAAAVSTAALLSACGGGGSSGGNANGNSGDANEWWSNSTVSLGSLPNANAVPQATGTYYTTTALLRVSFVPGTSTANFHNCLQRADGSARNCSLLSTGSYRTDTLGDARVMRFSGLPAMALRLSYARVLVERGGKVYFATRTRPVPPVRPCG